MRFLLLIFLCFYSFAASSTDWPEIIFPESSQVSIVADDMKMYGYPMRTWVVKDKQSQMMMASFFKKQWQKQSDKFDAQMFNGDYVINSLQSSFLLTARIHKDYEGVTAFVGITKNMDEDEVLKNTKSFPVPPGATILSDIQSTDIFKQGHTLVIQSGQSLSHNYHFYRRYYQRRGWVENTGMLDTRAGKAALQMSQGADLIDISFNIKKSKVYIVANQVMEGR
ncbi:hypothetical protein [Shewanella donghaensis]|uniref:hypothetical protein n=1 Tax=Shewanella donghaensis TaxID=238836 RepID=UPI0011833DB5|nr:hypothetical protein [Shewanella donghaensis]